MDTSQQAFELAVQYHQAGNFPQAEQLYRQILQADPRHVGALHLLGLIAHQFGRSDLAIEYISEAVQLYPDFPEARNNLAIILMENGRLDEAVSQFHEALRLVPHFAEALNNLGNALKAKGQPVEAEAHYRRALANKPSYPEAYNNLGIVLETQDRLAEAEASLRKALQLMPNYAEAHNNLGNLLHKRNNLGEAMNCYRQALRFKPDFAAAHYNLGLMLGHQELYTEAEASMREAIRLKPDYAEAFNYLGIVSREQGNLDEAVANYRQALHYQPNLPEPHNNLAMVLTIQGRFEEALSHYQRALELKADYVDAHYNLSHLRLMQGDFERGWADYEWRCRRPDHPLCPFPQPIWQGEPLAGRTILLRCEQGLGDTLQFVRYARLLKDRGAGKVILECPPSLARLLRRQSAIDQVVNKGEPLPSFDVYAFLLSLPRFFGTNSVAQIPADVPYLDADPDLVARWRTRLESAPGFHVGISWQGSRSHRGDRWRSVPASQFANLARASENVSLVSLQKGPGSEQLPQIPGLAMDLGHELTDFADTAAVLKSLDLVVTIDTALAHLAGALGVPVWVAIPFAPDWRWLLEREDSPWYPTMRLFRQASPDGWDEVFARMRQVLQERGL